MEPQNTQNTQMDIGEDRANLLSKPIICCALTVLHALGTGSLEKVYKSALVHELRESGLPGETPAVCLHQSPREIPRRQPAPPHSFASAGWIVLPS
jgi:hypothetical protein